jgi:F-type H+-transporting ATPase subunit epsilon
VTGLRLSIRTPEGLLIDRVVAAISAEDESGWFGILPGRRDVLASLPPGLLTFRDDDGEGFVALSGGLLELRGGQCRVMVREAQHSRELADVAEALADALSLRRRRGHRRRDVLSDLEREALRRMAREARS